MAQTRSGIVTLPFSDRSTAHTYATVLRLSVCRRRLSVTLCIVDKRCVL